MSLIDKQILADLGVELNDKQYRAMARVFDATVHRRVIDHMSGLLTDQQVDELRRVTDADPDNFTDWLDVNLPEFPEIVADEVDILLGEIAEDAEILSGRLQTKAV